MFFDDAKRSWRPLIILLGLTVNVAQAWSTIDFEDPQLPPKTARPATGDDHVPWIHQGVTFNRDWNDEFDCCPSGWAVSNQTDQITPGVENAYSAVALATDGGGRESSQFAVANNFQRGESRVQFPSPVEVQGMYITNTAYTYQAVVNGDDGAGFVKGPFGAGDWLRLDVIGLDTGSNETGRKSLFLADYRDGNATVVDAWTWLDLADLGPSVSALDFEMESTDMGPFGMNTPAYFAVDDLSFRLVPEPSHWSHLVLASLFWIRRRPIRRR